MARLSFYFINFTNFLLNHYFLNSIYLDYVEDASFTSGQIGLMAGSYDGGGGVHAVFDDLVVYQIE